MPEPAFNNFTFGCDPELFVLDSNDKLVAPHTFLPGTKRDPYPVKGGAVQVDGFAAEFNIDPAGDFATFNRNIGTVLEALTSMLPAGCRLHAAPSIIVPEDVFFSAPPHIQELGCTPDFNAWTNTVNDPPTAENMFLRTTSGHLHLGWREGGEIDEAHIANCNDLVKQLDWYLGGWANRIDKDTVRRELYGKAGACRYRPYGVEYRVLSNFWVSSRSRRESVWNRMQYALRDMANYYIPNRAPSVYNDFLIEYINTGKATPELLRNGAFPLTTSEYIYARF